MGLIQQGGSRVSTYVNGRQEDSQSFGSIPGETDRQENKSFGQKLRDTVPTRLKPQQIDFESAALNPASPSAGRRQSAIL
jgi:hypothetical protein